MKKILALHGVGSSGSIMRDQLGPLMRELGPRFEFVFLDGPFERGRGPGMAAYYPGPFYSYTSGYAPSDVRDALDDLEEFVHEHGPFDGVVGFSQGASMAAAYMLDRQQREPEAAPPFDFAVLFSSVAAFSADAGCYASIVAGLVGAAALDAFPGDADWAALPPKGRIVSEYLALTFTVARQIGAVAPDDDLAFFRAGADPLQVPRPLHPSLTPVRLRVPTVHVTGKADLPAMIEQSRLVQGLCESSAVRALQHAGGHSVPAKGPDVRAVAAAIDWAMSEGCRRRALHRALGKF